MVGLRRVLSTLWLPWDAGRNVRPPYARQPWTVMGSSEHVLESEQVLSISMW